MNHRIIVNVGMLVVATITIAGVWSGFKHPPGCGVIVDVGASRELVPDSRDFDATGDGPTSIASGFQTRNASRDEHSTRPKFRRLHDARVQEIP